MRVRCDLCGWRGTEKQLYKQKCPKCGSKSIWEITRRRIKIKGVPFLSLTERRRLKKVV